MGRPTDDGLPRLPGVRDAAEHRRLVARRLAGARQAQGLSQTAVAARMGTSQSVVARLESGALDMRLSTLERYAAALGRELVVGLAEPSRPGEEGRAMIRPEASSTWPPRPVPSPVPQPLPVPTPVPPVPRVPRVPGPDPNAPGLGSSPGSRLPLELADRLLSRRIVLLSGRMDQEVSTATVARLMLLDADSGEPVDLHLSCPDGDLGASLVLAEAIDLLRAPVTAVLLGNVGGAVVAVVAAADRRQRRSRGRPSLHPIGRRELRRRPAAPGRRPGRSRRRAPRRPGAAAARRRGPGAKPGAGGPCMTGRG